MMNQSVILTKYPQLRKTTNAVTTPDPEGHGLLPNTIDGTHSHLSISGIAKCLLLLLLLLLLSCLLYCSGQSGGGEEEPFAATVANIAYVVVPEIPEMMLLLLLPRSATVEACGLALGNACHLDKR